MASLVLFPCPKAILTDPHSSLGRKPRELLLRGDPDYSNRCLNFELDKNHSLYLSHYSMDFIEDEKG